MCDTTARLGITSILDVFMDTAALHAESLDFGPSSLTPDNLFWIVSRTKIHFNRRPEMFEDVTASTWILPAEKIRTERDYELSKGGEILAYGKSIWAVIDTSTEKVVRLEGIYPDIEFELQTCDEEPYRKVSRDFSDGKLLGEHRINASDVDMVGHMNNVAYVRAMLGLWPLDKLRTFEPTDIDLYFVSQSFEGETLRFMYREKDGYIEIGAFREDGSTKPAFLAAVKGTMS